MVLRYHLWIVMAAVFKTLFSKFYGTLVCSFKVGSSLALESSKVGCAETWLLLTAEVFGYPND